MIRDPDALRTVWLFGKPYWWDVQPGQPLVLRAATWIRSGGRL